MQQQQTETARFMAGLDKQDPHWYVNHATQVDLRQYADAALRASDARGTARERLRATVANRLLVAVRAAIEAGIVTYNEGPRP
jgi:hypothetical protein